MSSYRRNGSRVDLPALLEIGTKFQRETGWIPPSELAKKAQAQDSEDSGESAGGEADVASEAEETEESATSS